MVEKPDLRSLLMPVSDVANDLQADSTSALIAAMLNGSVRPAHTPTQTTASELGESIVAEIPSSFSSVIPPLMELKKRLLEELERDLSRLLTLNPGRREAIAHHLEKLAGMTSSPSSIRGEGDAAGGLRRWIEGPRNTAQTSALHGYFEEIALVVLGQALLLKAWADRGMRAWEKSDLANLNWTLAKALKPLLPLDREGWQITRPNLYSWYVPSAPILDEIWNRLGSLSVVDEGPLCLSALLGMRQTSRQSSGYDLRFLKALWEASPRFGFETETTPKTGSSLVPRRKFAFSPTLRDGAMVQTGPVTLMWIGTESSQYLLICAELVQLWWGPSAPPLWANSNGLDTHTRDQLTFGLGVAKTSVTSKIAEIEACDVSFVLEESPLRAVGRGIEAQQLREQLESLPQFKKIKKPNTTLGALQACVSLSKLRPGGLLWWAREEALSETEGNEVLNYLLDRARIVCEWNFSDLNHSLPSHHSAATLFPKYLYLLARESQLEDRLNNRPLRLAVSGHLRSHIELPLLFQDAIRSVFQAPGTSDCRGQWQIQISKSPTPQKDWSDHWPDPACQDTMRVLDQLREASHALAHGVTIRRTPETDAERPWSLEASNFGFWLDAVLLDNRRQLRLHPLPRPGFEAKGQGFVVLVPDESWVAPLKEYLLSGVATQWLDQHLERRGGRWILEEQTLRYIPVPRALWKALGATLGREHADELPVMAAPLPGELEKLVADALARPRKVLSQITAMPPDEATLNFHATLFVRASRLLDQLRVGRQRLGAVVRPDETIHWPGVLDILPKSEPVPLTQHPLITLAGNLSLHIPIARIERIKTPSTGLIMMTEIGLHMTLVAENSRVVEMVLQQLEGAKYNTLAEIIDHVRIPKNLQMAEATAVDLLKTFGEQTLRMTELLELLSACRIF